MAKRPVVVYRGEFGHNLVEILRRVHEGRPITREDEAVVAKGVVLMQQIVDCATDPKAALDATDGFVGHYLSAGSIRGARNPARVQRVCRVDEVLRAIVARKSRALTPAQVMEALQCVTSLAGQAAMQEAAAKNPLGSSLPQPTPPTHAERVTRLQS